MAEKPKVSIIMATWNRAHLISRAIESILMQTFSDWNLLIIDDGSTDATVKVVKEYMEKDQRISYYYQEHKGYAYAINSGCKMAKGELIAFADDDDISLPQRLELEVKEFEKDKEVELVHGLAKWVDNQGNALNLFPGMLRKKDFRGSCKEGFRLNLWQGCKIACPTIMMRKRHFPSNGEVFETKELTKCQDWLHNLEVAFQYRIVGLSQVLVEMNRGPARQAMMNDKEPVLGSYRKVLRLTYKRLGPKMTAWERFNNFRKAWGYQYMLEALVNGGWRGLHLLFKSLCCRPCQRRAWEKLASYFIYPLRKLTGLLCPPR